MNKQNGITLIALVVTIVVLLILAGITIGTLTGENGIIKMAQEARNKTEITEETEMLDLATINAMKKDRYGNITKENLQKAIEEIIGEGKVEITEESEENIFLVKFIESGRIYEVDKDGKVTYLGEETKLLGQAEIVANPESNATPKLIHQVEVEVKTPLTIEDENITLVYAWNQNASEEPDTSKYISTTTTKTGRTRKTIINSIDTAAGDYYLWIKVIIGENEIVKCFGPYTIKDHTTLVVCNTEKDSTSGFLGNTNIARNLIQKVTIETSLGSHTTSEEKCWDVSQSQDGTYLAWYETNEAGYYEVTIGGKGGVVANSDSSYLFANIGYGLEDEVKIEGLENLDTGLTTSMYNMFSNCINTVSLNVGNWNTSNVNNIARMFYGCKNLTNIDVSKWDTSKVTQMGAGRTFYGSEGTFQGCSSLTSIDVSKWDTSNVIYMGYMFGFCSSLTSINVSNWDTSQVTNLFGTFQGCSSLTNLDVSNWDTSEVKYMGSPYFGYGGTFQDCSSLKSIDVSNWDTSDVTLMGRMFAGCSSLTNLDLSNFKTGKVTSMDSMFY